MRRVFKKPIIEILLFDEEDITTASGDTPVTPVTVQGITAAEDVNAQMTTVLGSGKSSSVTTIRMEDIQTQ